MAKQNNNPSIPKKNLAGIVLLFVIFLIVLGIVTFLAFKGKNDPTAVGGSTAIYFNEVMTSNKGSAIINGKCPDWIELYNNSDLDTDISGYVLTNSDGSKKMTFPKESLIRAKSCYLVYIGARTDSFSANFTLEKAGGESFILKSRDGTQIDMLITLPLDSEESMTRVDYTSNIWNTTTKATPGYPNTEDGYVALLESRKSIGSLLKINEVMPQNTLTVKDKYGLYSDYIEIINDGAETINLKNYSLSDDEGAPFKWQFPNIDIKSGDCLLVFASGKDEGIHTSFKLKAAKGTVVLGSPDGKILDSISYEEITSDQAIVRTSDGCCKSYSPTPGYKNENYDNFSIEADAQKPDLVINEAMSKNTKYIKQNGGKTYDWIEIKNVSSKAVNLSDYFLSSDSEEPQMWQLPDKILESNELYIVVASGNEILSNSLYKHTNFKINDDEVIYLYSKNGTLLDGACLKGTPIDYSYGRVPGQSGFYYISSPSPYEENNQGIRAVTDNPKINTVSGVFNNSSGVKISISGEGHIFYTLDGSEPTKEDAEYKEEFEVNKTAVVRAAGFADDKIKSTVTSASYLINENHTLPVMSVMLDPSDMYGSNGIYTNFEQSWEKSAYAEFFEEGKNGFSLPCGIKMFGAFSRERDKKSFQLKFKDMYGADALEYRLFDNQPDIMTYNSLVLRSGSQDDNRAMMRDEFLTSLAQSESTQMYTQAYKPTVLYINGEYFGVYYFREKIDEDYVSQHLNVLPQTVSLLESGGNFIYTTPEMVLNEDLTNEYRDLVNYVVNHDMNDEECYKYVESKMDFESYIDMKIASIYSDDYDRANVRFFKSTDGDGKWHWIFYDVDWAFGGYADTIDFHIRERGKEDFSVMNLLAYNLLKNPNFKDKFISRLGKLMTSTYTADNATEYINRIYERIKPEMERNCQRWGNSYAGWERNVDELREIVKTRATNIIEDAKTEFKLSSDDFIKYFGG